MHKSSILQSICNGSIVNLPAKYVSRFTNGKPAHRVLPSSFVVCLVHLVYLVSLVHLNKRNKPNKQKQPAGLHVSRGTCSFVPQALAPHGLRNADRPRSRGKPVFLQLREERFVVDVERFRRVGLVAAAGVEDALDVEPFDLIQGQVCEISRLK